MCVRVCLRFVLLFSLSRDLLCDLTVEQVLWVDLDMLIVRKYKPLSFFANGPQDLFVQRDLEGPCSSFLLLPFRSFLHLSSWQARTQGSH